MTPSQKKSGTTRSQRALIAATRSFLKNGDSDFTIVDVANAAETSVQTIYNHFSNREGLIAAAVQNAIDEFQSDMLQATTSLSDPLEQLSTSMRLFGRLPESHPHLASIVVNAPRFALAGPRGYTPEALIHVTGLKEAGLIFPSNLELALTATVASIERLMYLRSIDPSRSVNEVDELAEMNLLVFGISPEKARELVQRPLPKISQ